MKQLSFIQAIAPATDALSHGRAFLTVAGDTPNTMVIGWGSIGFYWNKPIFTVVVRPQRHTFDMLMKAGEFTVSIPTKNELREQLAFAGTQSGRDYNKFKGHGLTATPSLKVNAPIIGECGLHFECKTLLTQPMTGDNMAASVKDYAYPERDYHTMFFGEIVEIYTTDE